jgi:hypothetical protein
MQMYAYDCIIERDIVDIVLQIFILFLSVLFYIHN